MLSNLQSYPFKFRCWLFFILIMSSQKNTKRGKKNQTRRMKENHICQICKTRTTVKNWNENDKTL